MISSANQLTGFYIMRTLVVKGLNDLELLFISIVYNVKNVRIISSKNEAIMLKHVTT